MDLAIHRMPNYTQFRILCSSGVDSIAASHYFHKKFHRGSLNYSVLHFNHQQRPQNDLMSEKYLTFGYDHHVPRYTPVNLKDHGYFDFIDKITEDALRDARLSYIRTNYDKTIFVTAHHLDDATESYMMNVLRGKEGFQPIPFITEVGSNLIIHPFLFTKKADFVKYAEKKDLMKYVVEDETNKVTKGSRRNFIRNEIMPLLQREKMGLSTIVEKKMKERLMLELIKG